MYSVTLKVGGATWSSFWEVFLFSWSNQHVYFVFFLRNPSGQVVHDRRLVPRGKMKKKKKKKEKKTPKLGIVCERYWLPNLNPNLAPAFEQHMELPPKNKQCQPNKIPTSLEYEILYYCGPHGSGHHPTLVHTFSST